MAIHLARWHTHFLWWLWWFMMVYDGLWWLLLPWQSTSLADTHTFYSGEKPNKCNQCDYAFSRAADLKTHSFLSACPTYLFGLVLPAAAAACPSDHPDKSDNWIELNFKNTHNHKTTQISLTIQSVKLGSSKMLSMFFNVFVSIIHIPRFDGYYSSTSHRHLETYFLTQYLASLPYENVTKLWTLSVAP